MTARLIVSLSGVDDRTLDGGVTFGAELASRGVPLSVLVAPRLPARPGLAATAAWAAWVADQAGAAVLLHGCDHLVPAGMPKIRRRAEFATLPAHEAGLRLAAATAAMEQLGLSTDLFAPPRWLASPGTLDALRRRRFALCAGASEVHDLRTGRLHRGRVFGFGHGELAEPLFQPLWRRAAALGMVRVARRGGLLRLAVTAEDLRHDGRRRAVLDTVDYALDHGAAPGTYRSLCGPVAARGAA